MKAVVVEEYGPYRNARVGEVDAPEPGDREVLVQVSTVGVNFPDVLMIAGRHPVRPALPFVPGMELAGTVAAVGADVTEVAVGDRVAGEVDCGAWGPPTAATASPRKCPSSMRQLWVCPTRRRTSR